MRSSDVRNVIVMVVAVEHRVVRCRGAQGPSFGAMTSTAPRGPRGQGAEERRGALFIGGRERGARGSARAHPAHPYFGPRRIHVFCADGPSLARGWGQGARRKPRALRLPPADPYSSKSYSTAGMNRASALLRREREARSAALRRSGRSPERRSCEAKRSTIHHCCRLFAGSAAPAHVRAGNKHELT